MGKVFCWNEIIEGKIPQLSNFAVIVNKIKRDLENANSIIGGVIYGSVPSNTHNERSDIDCIVIYFLKKRYEAFQVLRAIYKSAARVNIPIEMIPIDDEIAKTPFHHVRFSFANHFSYAVKKGGLIKINPLSLLTFNHTNITEDIREYLRNKLRYFEKGIAKLPIMTEDEYTRLLQKTLELPLHVARKMLLLRKVELPDDNRETIMKYYPSIANPQEQKLFLKITTADEEYTKEILRQIKSPNRTQYFKKIEELKSLTLDAVEFVRTTTFHLA